MVNTLNNKIIMNIIYAGAQSSYMENLQGKESVSSAEILVPEEHIENFRDADISSRKHTSK